MGTTGFIRRMVAQSKSQLALLESAARRHGIDLDQHPSYRDAMQEVRFLIDKTPTGGIYLAILAQSLITRILITLLFEGDAPQVVSDSDSDDATADVTGAVTGAVTGN
jgi:hypothetical protein